MNQKLNLKLPIIPAFLGLFVLMQTAMWVGYAFTSQKPFPILFGILSFVASALFTAGVYLLIRSLSGSPHEKKLKKRMKLAIIGMPFVIVLDLTILATQWAASAIKTQNLAMLLLHVIMLALFWRFRDYPFQSTAAREEKLLE